jgi:hypothetical protein
LQAELSAGLKAGEDPLYYDWTRVAEAPPSEAAYVPPMQIQTRSMDTRDLAAIIGRDAAVAARHAPSPENTVVIAERAARPTQDFEVDTIGSGFPTEEMHRPPVSDPGLMETRLLSIAAPRPKRGWIGLAAGAVIVIAVALLVWPTRGLESDASPSNVAPAPVPTAGTAPSRAAVAIGELPAEPTTPIAPLAMSFHKVSPAVAQEPDRAPARRSIPSGSSARGRAVSPPKVAPSEVDPLVTENPGY